MRVSILFRGRGSRLMSPSPFQNEGAPIPARESEVNGGFLSRGSDPALWFQLVPLHAFVKLATMAGRPAGRQRQLTPSALWPLYLGWNGTANADGGREGLRVRWRAPIECNASCDPQRAAAAPRQDDAADVGALVPLGWRSHRRPGPHLVLVCVQGNWATVRKPFANFFPA